MNDGEEVTLDCDSEETDCEAIHQLHRQARTGGFDDVNASITLGSGGSGGIFAAALVIGGVFGSAYGTVFRDIVPIA